jgi:hypothetical protein
MILEMRALVLGRLEETIAARDWTYFPPLAQAQSQAAVMLSIRMWGETVPGGYRNAINDNVVLILTIETLEGLQHARGDRQGCVPD